MCCATTFRNWQRYSCGRRGKVERGGKHYCGIHDPAKKEAKRVAMTARINRIGRRNDAERAVRDARDILIARICSDVHCGMSCISDGTRDAVAGFTRARNMLLTLEGEP